MQFQMPAMIFDDLTDNRETKSGALLARRHIGFEQLLAVVARQTFAIVDNIDNQLPIRLIRTDDDMPAFAFLGAIFLRKSVNGFAGILDNIAERPPSRRLSKEPTSFSGPKSFWKRISLRLTSIRKEASRNVSRMSISRISGFGMRAKAENSSTMRPMSPTGE